MASFSGRRMLAVTRKETQELVRNWLNFLLAIVAPIILFFLFAYGMSFDVKNIPMAILDEDRSFESRELVDTFCCGQIFNVMRIVTNLKDVETLIRENEMRLIVVIPSGFGRNLRKGVPQQVLALMDAVFPNRANMVGGYCEAAISDYSDRVLGKFFSRTFGPSMGSGGALPVTLSTSPWFNPTFRSEDFILPGVMAIILVFLPPTIAAISLSKEKETGSILNMFCSPISKSEYILGKAIPYVAITYGLFLVFLAFTVFIFAVPFRGSLVLLMIVSFFYVLTVIGLGIFVAVLVKTQIAAILLTSILNMIPTFMYSGFMFPVICMDASAKSTAYMLPSTYYISFVRKLMLKGVGIEYLWVEALILAGMALFLFTTSIILFKKRL